MKLGRILYLLGIIAMAVMGYIMQKHGWNFMATLMGIMVVAGFFSYWEFVELNPIDNISSRKVRRRKQLQRAENWKKMTAEQQDFYLDSIEQEIIDAHNVNN